MVTSKNISIGKDTWIKWIEFDPKFTKAKQIDSIIEPTKEFWTYLETECVAECCGLDAFSFWPEDIQSATHKAGIPNLELSFSQIIKDIESFNDEVLMSFILNQLINRKVFLQLLEHIKTNIQNT